MKIAETNVDTFSFGQKEVSVAQIQASAKAFEILSSSLYSNSVLAIIRELCANAKDSHTAAGKPTVPFHVQIPNELDPQFKVRDFGVGMNHEFVMTRLNTYFDSTKNGSNDEIGGFGLGIKSVFSYTTGFMISCYDGQKRRVYTYQIGSSGVPEVSFLTENESSEPLGVEVSVPVKQEDYQEFKDNCVEALTFYNPRPTITGINPEHFVIEELYSGSNWTIYRNPGLLSNESYIKMGDVIYPIIDNLYDEVPAHLRQQMRSYRNRSRGDNTAVVVYTAGIGDIDITPNREQIKLTPKSKEQINQFEETVKEELHKQMQGYINSFTCSYWKLMEDEKVRDLFRSSILHKFDVNLSKMKYHGVSLDPHGSIRYCAVKADSKVLAKIKFCFSAESYYGSVNLRKVDFHPRYGIEVSGGNAPMIVVGEMGFSKKITTNQINEVFCPNSRSRSRVYLIEANITDHQEIINDINKFIPDYSDRIIQLKDIADQLAKVKEPDQYLKYDVDGSSYYNNDPVDFDLKDFANCAEVFYETPTARNGGGYGRHALTTKLNDVFHYMDEEVVEAIKKLGIRRAYALTESQVDRLKAAGIKTTVFTSAIEKVLMEIATTYANTRPTMTLKEFLKPLIDKNPRICLSSHYKAVKRWVKESGNTDMLATLRAMNDESSSSYRHTAEDKLFRSVTQAGVKEFITQKKIVATKVTSNQVVIDLVTKAPLCARLVSDYTDQEVIDYVTAAMGWPVQVVVATKPKRSRSKKAAQAD